MSLDRCRGAILVTSFFAALLPGCGQSNVRFQWTRATVARNARGVDVVRFDAAIVVRGMAGQQALYEVSVNDRDGQPVLSQDQHYCNRRGQVAAVRAFHIGLPLQRISDLSVSIPITQLEASAEQHPISAQVGIYRPSGETLATASCAFPEDALPTGVAHPESVVVMAPTEAASGE